LPSTTTDRDDFLSVVKVDTVDANGDTKNLGDEWDSEVLLQHGEETDTLF
jgi:hypothetical protein